jgi:protein SCO1/2/putative membrane protein
VNRSYRLGLTIVLVAVTLAAVLAPLVPPPRPARAAWDLAAALPPLGAFRLTERSGRTVTDRDLADRVWVASFVFTRCHASCPRISTAMKDVQRRLKGTGVQLVSITVDPDRDTPAVLTRYAESLEADPRRWWFLTGSEDEIGRLVRERFKLSLAPMDPNDPEAARMELAHSDRLALVDRGNRVVGLYNPFERKVDGQTDPGELDVLVARARRLDREWVARLPAVNASLNGLSACLLLLGLPLILTNRVRGHNLVMLAALAVSTLFLACYLVYHGQIGGGVPFRGVGMSRLVYFTVLISHVLLAALMVPLIVLTVLRALRKQFDRHAPLARVTYPIWLYVSITGVVVYMMLYQWPLRTVSG